MKTIVTLAKKLQAQMTISDRKDGTKYYHLKRSNNPEWMTEVINAIHGEKLPDNTTYEFIDDALNIICDLDDEATEDDIQEVIYERTEADIYTSDLTAWLHARNDHVYYLTEVLEELDIKDGFQALSAAQARHKEEVAFGLINELIKQI